MGGLTSSLGFGGGSSTGKSGVNFDAASANILNPVSVDQANAALNTSNNALSQQQQFLNALQAQNGIGNQSNIFNQLGGIVAGTGPNPATAQLANATAANTANQAALMAGQRGAGANTGLIARQAAQTGAANQQISAGQAAALQAQQSLNALNMQGGLATQQVGQQQAATLGLNQIAQGEQQQLLNSIAAQNNANVGMQGNINEANSKIANTVAQGQQGLVGSIMGAAGSAVGLAKGGVVPPQKFAMGGTPTITGTDPNAPKSNVGKFFSGPAQVPQMRSSYIGGDTNPGAEALQSGSGQLMSGLGKMIGKVFQGSDNSTPLAGGPMDAAAPAAMDAAPAVLASRGGKVPALVSPGEKYLPPKDAKNVAEGKKNPMKAGETIKGKAKVKGDSEVNDTVPKTLEAGGVVIPRSVMQSDDPAHNAYLFVQAHLSKKNKTLPGKAK